jgi:hypothetical protein
LGEEKFMYTQKLDPIKLKLIDELLLIDSSIKTSADLGACWGVDGGYSRYLLDKHGLERVAIVDQHVTDGTLSWAYNEPRAIPTQGLLGDDETIHRVGDVDVVIFFDVLLHQVAPDWDEVLAKWAPRAKYILIHNPMWTVGSETLRLPDHGFEWFKANVVYQNEARLKDWFDRFDEFDGEQNKKKKDVHNFWQFGITQRDLLSRMMDLGFSCEYHSHFKSRVGKPWIQNFGYIFRKEQDLPAAA